MRDIAIEYVDPATLRPAPYNPREAPPEHLRRLAGLLDRHGFVAPLIARRTDRLVIGGHQRLRANALRRRPSARVPVVFLDEVSDARARALNVALNNPRSQGRFAPRALADLLDGLADEVDLPELTGFDPEDVADLIGAAEDLPDLAEDLPPPESFQVVVDAGSEAAQRALYERLSGEGFRCRLLIL